MLFRSQGAEVKQEVVVREGCFRVGHAAVVTLTTKGTATGDPSGLKSVVQICRMGVDEWRT